MSTGRRILAYLSVLALLVLAAAGCRVAILPTATPPAIDSPLSPTPSVVTGSPTAPPSSSSTPAPASSGLPEFVSVVEKVRPAVVSIQSTVLTRNFFGQIIPGAQSGSGAILDARGYILTNNHVIEGGQDIEVSLPDGRVFPAQVVGTDPLTDLAVVRVEGNDLPTMSFAAAAPKVGEWVLAIGNALALKGGPTVTEGIVSALDRSITIEDSAFYDLIQTSAAINPGNSGGPLINLRGDVVGINSARASGENIGYAISVSTAQPIFQDLVATGKVAQPFMGVDLDDVTPATAAQENLPVQRGAVLTRVIDGFPASSGGLRPGDIIVSIQGQEVKDATQLIVLIRRHRAGDKVEVAYYRGQEKKTVEITLAARPQNP